MERRRDAGGVRIRPSWIWAAGLSLITLLVLGVPPATLGYLAILLVCPLTMLFMHGTGHGHQDGHGTMEHGTSSPPEAPDVRGSRRPDPGPGDAA